MRLKKHDSASGKSSSSGILLAIILVIVVAAIAVFILRPDPRAEPAQTAPISNQVAPTH